MTIQHGYKIIGFLMQNMCMNKMVKTKNRYIGKVVDNVSYRGVLVLVYHDKHTSKLKSSNRMQFHHGKEQE
jgi:hypothetical protein